MTVRKKDLVARAARRSRLTKAQTRQALDALLNVIAETLAAGDTVVLGGFGRFETQLYPERKLRRFDGDGHYKVQSRPIPVFKPSVALRRRVRQKQ